MSSCLNPFRIRNKSLFYVSGLDKVEFQVPCGNCPACRDNVRNEWIIRSYFQWKYTKEVLHGSVIFATLTYNDYHLPLYKRDILDTGEQVFIKGFNYNHLKRFLNSLRKHYETRYGINGIKYFVSTEFGGKSTKRPHYHILLFFPYLPESENQIKETIRNYWKFGFVGYTPNYKGGCFVETPQALKYVAKYVTKDMDFYGQSAVIKYMDFLKRFKKSHQVTDFQKYKLLVRDFSNLKPRHYQSHNYGEYMCTYILKDDNYLHYFKHGITIPTETYRYPVPTYIHDKLCYESKHYYEDDLSRPNFVKDRVFRKLTEFGSKLSQELFGEKIDLLAADMEKTFSFIGLHNAFSGNADLNNFFLDKGYSFNDYDDLYTYVNTLIGDSSFKGIASYVLLFGDVAERYFLEDDILRHRFSYMIDFPLELPDTSPLSDSELFRREKIDIDNNADFMEVMNLYNSIKNYEAKKCKYLKQEKEEKIKDFKHKFIYDV